MTRADTDTSPVAPKGACDASGTVAPTDTANRKLAEFRERLDAFRMRTRAQYAPIRSAGAPTSHDVSDEDSGRALEARGEPEAGEGGAPEIAEAPEPTGADAAGESGEPYEKCERFEIMLSPTPARSLSADAPSRKPAIAPLAVGLAAAVVLFSGAAVVDATLSKNPAGLHGVSESLAERFAAIQTATVRDGKSSVARRRANSANRSQAGLKGYLDVAALRALLKTHPVKCVIETTPNSAKGAGAQRSRGAGRRSAHVAKGCVETIAYEADASMLLRRAPAPGGGRIEINTAFSIEGDALCHQTQGLSALVIGGEMPAERARSLESLLGASYANLGGAPICHRLKKVGEAKEGPLFQADAFVGGRHVAERTDPRPFLMQRRDAATIH